MSPAAPPPGPRRVDYPAICAVDHECTGGTDPATCCCARYDVCATGAEVRRITAVLPDAARVCPHLKTPDGYANVFEETDDGLHAIDTHENGLCVFAYTGGGKVRCSLHTVALDQGRPADSIKPEVCSLFPLTFSEDGRVLTLHHDALACTCTTRRTTPSTTIAPALLETIDRYFGKRPSRPT